MRKWVVLAVALALSGCGTIRDMHNRQELDASLAAYKSCLQQHPADAAKACETTRLAYQAELDRRKAQAEIQVGR